MVVDGGEDTCGSSNSSEKMNSDTEDSESEEVPVLPQSDSEEDINFEINDFVKPSNVNSDDLEDEIVPSSVCSDDSYLDPDFVPSVEENWKFDISNQAADDLNMSKWNKVTIVPLASDLKILKEYLTTTAINRKRTGELQRLLVSKYEETGINGPPSYEEFTDDIFPMEKILIRKLKRIMIRGKTGKGVPVLFSEDVQDHIKLLLEIFNMSESELEQLATFMGHTINVHKNSYRLPDDVYQTAKITKLLLLMGKGTAAEYKGRSLEEINFNLEEDLNVADDTNKFDDLCEELNEDNTPIIPTEDNTPIIPTEDDNNITLIQSNDKKKRVLTPWTEN
ncbi:hypothetical protein FQA39_LY15678 [Lamprigera yunnana]|nr:hypothetical protein FQA39_LY15678 [Lamprigera yunnana]